MKNTIQSMSKDKTFKKKKQFLDELFVPPKPKSNEVLAESENYFPNPDFESVRNSDSSTLSLNLLPLEKSVENLTVQNKSLTRENEKLRHQCEKATQKVAEKSQLLAHFRTRNFSKEER